MLELAPLLAAPIRSSIRLTTRSLSVAIDDTLALDLGLFLTIDGVIGAEYSSTCLLLESTTSS